MKKRIKIGFVILHYNELEETIKCISSIEKNCDKDYCIVVVDNGSSNGSGKKLLEKYKEKEQIYIKLNEENLGFARGNNIGCNFIRKNFECDYIFTLNNDTELVTENIVTLLDKIYSNTKFDILGPKIWNIAKKYNQNPHLVISNLKGAQQNLHSLLLQKKMLELRVFPVYIIWNRCRNYLCDWLNIKVNKENFVHGAAIIYSKKYFLRYGEVFIEKSFLYGEEAMLYYRAIQDNLVFIFNNEIEVIHHESISTKRITSNKYSKWLFQNKHMINAYKELIKLYQEEINL